MILRISFILLLMSIFKSSCYASINSHTNQLAYKPSSSDLIDNRNCFQSAQCQPLRNATCFGTALPYSFTSVALADDSISQFDVQDNLALWQGLRSVPRCWAVVQPLLCAVYMPKCENGSVSLPTQEMCRITRGPCKSVEVKHSWPSFLRCENKNLFPSRCRNPLQEIKFNTSYKCISPLVETDENWFNEIEGCGLQCQDPLFSESEHEYTHHIIAIFATLGLLSTGFTVATFKISWKAANRYPSIIIFYISLCLLMVYFGWLIQFFPGAREKIVCRHDGTMRRRQPRSGEYLCVISFILIYPFQMAAIIWFVIMAYSWYILFREMGSFKDIIKKRAKYFHICAWCIPLVSAVTIMGMKEVDGDSMSGICFVGFSNLYMRIIFVLLPIGIAALLEGFFFASCLHILIKGRLSGVNAANEKSVKKLRRMKLKISVYFVCSVILIVCTFACHAYNFINQEDWMENLREYIVCLAMNSAQSYSNMGELPMTKCSLKSKPSLFVLQLHLFCVFAFGIITSMWAWTKASREAWKSCFFRLCAPSVKNSHSLKKHQVISKVFPRRGEIHEGPIAISVTSRNEDPVGMDILASSVASGEISTSWANAVPHFCNRRNAVTALTHFVPRQFSSNSDISRHISDSFNQQNLDSLSMQISEKEYAAHVMRHQRRKTKKERERFRMANPIASWFPGNRRGSDTSLQSSLMAASYAAAAAKNMGTKITKSTSTGDLEVQGSLIVPNIMPTPLLYPPPNRMGIQREPANHPFTFAQVDKTNGNRLDSRNLPPCLRAVSVAPRFSPNRVMAGFPNPLEGMVHPQGYELMNGMPCGYMGGVMCSTMNGVCAGYSSATGFSYPQYNVMPYIPYGMYPNINQNQPNLLPMQPRAESASEPEFFPVVLSESEFSDAGHRSYDEVQLLTTQCWLHERRQAQILAGTQIEALQPKPLQPQVCAKTQILQRMNSCNVKIKTATNVASLPPPPPTSEKAPSSSSGRKSPEAPPPSPVPSSKSLDIGDDSVFDSASQTNENPENITELGNNTENLPQKS